MLYVYTLGYTAITSADVLFIIMTNCKLVPYYASACYAQRRLLIRFQYVPLSH